MGKLDGKVAFITGIARGQGRSHAVALAAEGADIIGFDILENVGTVDYPLATQSDLDETVKLVEDLDRKIFVTKADVRDYVAVQEAYRAGVEAVGPVDIILGNAGVTMLGATEADPVQSFRDMIDINLIGVWNTVHVAMNDMIARGQGGAIVLTSSTQGLSGRGADGTSGVAAYAAAKHGVVGLMRNFAVQLGKHGIRVNSIHPTGVATPMVINDQVGSYSAEDPAMFENLMPVELIESSDVSSAILYLVSDDARYVTGLEMKVDAGFTVK